MLVLEGLGEAETTTFDDGSVVLLVPEDVVLTAAESGDNAKVDTEAGAVNHDVFLADVLGDALLELLVEVECAVEEGRTGASCAELAGGLDGCFLDTGVVYQAGVAVAAEHQHFFAVDNHLGVLLGRDGAEIGINARSLGFLRSRVFRKFCL